MCKYAAYVSKIPFISIPTTAANDAMDFAGSSRPVSGSEYLFSHALDYYSENKNLHGIQTGMGTISVLKLIGKDVSNLIDYLGRFDVNINPKKLGIDESTFIYCLQHATEMRDNRYTYLNEIDLSKSHIKKVYSEMVSEI